MSEQEQEYEIHIENMSTIAVTDASPEGAVEWVRSNYLDQVEWTFKVYLNGELVEELS